MSTIMPFRAFTFAAVSIVALAGAPAFAGTVLTLPATGTGAVDGSGLTVTNTENYQGAGNPRPFAIEGLGSGTTAGGVLGETTNTGGIGVEGVATKAGAFGVYGANTGSGFGGYFLLDGAVLNAANSALEAINSGGSATTENNWGSAGNFQITNTMNQSPAVAISTGGINSHALHVVNSGTIDYNVEYVPPGEGDADFGGVAGYFEINTPDATDHANQAAIFVVNSSGGASPNTYGPAAIFEITNPNNNSAALRATSDNPSIVATAIYGAVAGSGVGVSGDADGAGGEGVYGQSANGYGVFGDSVSGDSGYFFHGSGGTGSCWYDGGATWSCVNPADAMNDLAAPNYAELLDKLDVMPVNYYRLKAAQAAERYLGPSAEDFKTAFGLGRDDKSIRDGNASGVALAAAKGLYQKLKADEATIAADHAEMAALKDQLAEQKAALAEMKAAVSRLAQSGTGMREASLTAR